VRNTFFTSDTHFLHRNIIKYCSRPFVDECYPDTDERHFMVKEMNEKLISNWNAVVKPNDVVYHLGDFSYTGPLHRAIQCRMSLNGEIHLIEGNHDQHALEIQKLNPWLQYGVPFKSVERLSEVTIDNQRIIMCHFALREWHHCLRGTWHIFGHTHATLRPFGKSVDVGVDNCGEIVSGASFRPIHYDELKVFMDAQPIGPHPCFEHYRPGHPELNAKSYTEVS
jgi:calcineurin-like phosphoesterase family protein